MAKTEHIAHEVGNEEAWICICNNIPSGDGFYPCDEQGNEVDPIPQEWSTGLYVCAKCGRMIDPKTLEVVGRAKAPNPHSMALMNKRLPSDPIAYVEMEEKYNKEHVN